MDEKFFLDQGYLRVRKLEDGTFIGLGKLIFTTAIYCDLDQQGYDKRFCFEKPEKALEEFNKMKTINDEPSGYVARRE